MNFFVENIASILQGLSAIGVIGTVFFLVRELNEQNKVARANVRQNVADSHQKMALAGMKKDIVKIKLKLRKDEELTELEEEWDSMLKSFKTLFRSKYHLKLWSFMRDTFDEEFVIIVDEIVEGLK